MVLNYLIEGHFGRTPHLEFNDINIFIGFDDGIDAPGARMVFGGNIIAHQFKQQKEEISELKALLENRPDTYSGTDVIKQQNKMFKFQNTVNKVEGFLEETKDVENE